MVQLPCDPISGSSGSRHVALRARLGVLWAGPLVCCLTQDLWARSVAKLMIAPNCHYYCGPVVAPGPWPHPLAFCYIVECGSGLWAGLDFLRQTPYTCPPPLIKMTVSVMVKNCACLRGHF